MSKTKISPVDYKFMYEKPDGDPDFNYERNKKIIDDSIKSYEKLREIRQKLLKENIQERANVIATWATSMKGQNKPIEDYIGRKYMTELAGEKIMAKIKRLKEFREKHPNVIIT